MKKYAFELGTNKELSLYELTSLLGEKNLLEKNPDFALFSLELKNPRQLQDNLGGTIKIVEIVAEYGLKKDKQEKKLPSAEMEQDLERLLDSHFEGHEGKVNFAVTVLGFKKYERINSKDLLKFSKKFLKSLNLNSRFINKNFFENPPSAALFKAKVLEKGMDINLIKGENQLYLGKTVALQDIDAYSFRDYEKPRRDAKIGMLPPKLAQIMINFAGPTKTIFDPFCGTGTVLTEGILMGKTVAGSDISPRMVEYSEENCLWLKKNFGVDEKFFLFTLDAQHLSKKTFTEKTGISVIDAIVTEGYLGRPLTSFPKQEEQNKIFRELSNLHVNWLRAAAPLLKKNQKIVMCVAAFQNKNGNLVHLPRFQEMAELAGFDIEKTFTYGRKDQIVVRDIKVLVKK